MVNGLRASSNWLSVSNRSFEMKEFTEELRYEYDLKPDSWVIDIGAHTGTFSREIGRRYNCNILGFEPIYDFWKEAMATRPEKASIIHCGIGDSFRNQCFYIKGDMTGAYADGPYEIVSIIPFDSLNFKNIDLLKINCEGGEYEILETMLKFGMQEKFKNIQVQFHDVVPNAI